MRKKFVYLQLILFFSFVSQSYAETFYLKDGRVVEGTVREENEERIKLENATIKSPDNLMLQAASYYINKNEIDKKEGAGSLNQEFKGENAEGAKETYQNVQSLEYYNLGVTYAIQGRFEEARAEFENSLKVAAIFTPAQESIALLEDVKHQRIDQEIAVRIFKLVTLQDFDRIVAELEDMVSLKPQYTRLHTLLGVAYLHQKMIDKARSEFEEAVQIEPNGAITHNNLGVIAIQKKMFGAAKAEFERALQFNPKFPEALDNLELVKTLEQLPGWEHNESAVKDLPIQFKFKTASGLIF